LRIGLIGLSTPLYWDYRIPAGRGPADDERSETPNPILDSALGLMLFFDELWFLTRSLCPKNLRDAPFCRFLDEEGRLPDVSDVDVYTIASNLYEPLRGRLESNREILEVDVVSAEVRRRWGARPDNHSRTLQLGSSSMAANAGALECILFDLAVLQRLGRSDIELVSNSLGQRWMDMGGAESPDALAHILVVDELPNYLSPDGPYHPVVEEARDNKHLRHFRDWVATTSSVPSPRELMEVKEEVREGIRESQEELFLKWLDPSSHYQTMGKTVLGTIADLFAGPASSMASLFEEFRDKEASSRLRWQGFIVSFGQAARRLGG
jgi:hypothetical protein